MIEKLKTLAKSKVSALSCCFIGNIPQYWTIEVHVNIGKNECHLLCVIFIISPLTIVSQRLRNNIKLNVMRAPF